MTTKKLKELARLARYYIIVSTTSAGSGHPTSCLSATDIMVGVMFSGAFRADLKNPQNPNNDRIIFSKGHAAPLLYALYAVTGKISEKDLLDLRKFNSPLEGHPTMLFPYTEVATGSLGQGLSVGLGLSLASKTNGDSGRVFVLMGDSEIAEGSVWEAIELARYYKVDNLVGIIDVNRLGQTGETMLGHDTPAIEARVKSFGWRTKVIDGHNWQEISQAVSETSKSRKRPLMIIARTIKGKGVDFLEDKNGWHGKALSKEQEQKALEQIGAVDRTLQVQIPKPESGQLPVYKNKAVINLNFKKGEILSTRKAYGKALAELVRQDSRVIALDAEVSNSTFAELAKIQAPQQFFEMFIAEQNMVGVGLGFSRRKFVPFLSTFSSFFTRAFDQIRMCQYSRANIKFVGSHAGVSIGEDGASQMGLEDIAMFRALLGSVVVYPSDAVSCQALVQEIYRRDGIAYLRTTRMDLPVIYNKEEKFPIGASKVLANSSKDKITLVAAGVTLHEALKASSLLKKQGIHARVIDLYSVKPLDLGTLRKALKDTGAIIVAEDHFQQGGIGEAVSAALARDRGNVYSLSVSKMPRSGKPKELLDWEGISARSISQKALEIVGKNANI